jgi:feruloyl esterase
MILNEYPSVPQKLLKTFAAAALATTAFAAATPAKADSCSNLAQTFHRQNTTITTAQTISAGTFEGQSNLPKFCRVAGFTTPTSDSHIEFEVWMPESGWNLKYAQVGCGGYCGTFSLQYPDMARLLQRGYVAAATDDGHESASYTDASWGLGHPEKVIDFAYRSLKETSDVSKGLILALHNSGPRHSYFFGCSDGGREAMMVTQRYPLDFDGVIAGAAANYWTHHMTGAAWTEAALSGISGGDLSQSDLNTLSSSMLAKCVGRDGGLGTDQFLNNPLVCRFDPKTLSLSQDKIEAIEKVFSGPPGIYPGYRDGGGEANLTANWPVWVTGSGNLSASFDYGFASNTFQYLVFANPAWTPTTFTAAENAKAADKQISAINAMDFDLRPFKSHGGKLIQYNGWSDSAVVPAHAIDDYRGITNAMGDDKTQDFYRLFMVPGMSHCQGGPGANTFGQPYAPNGPNPSDPADDILSALDNWVENNRAPEQIVATKFQNDDPTQGIVFQRPLCPFPKFAKYRGEGKTTSASSFECVAPQSDKFSDNR